MLPEAVASLLPSIYDAALDPSRWPSVVEEICKYTGAIGGGYVVRSTRTNRVVTVDAAGVTKDAAEEYIAYYSKSDPFWPAFERSDRRWFSLSKLKTETDLTGNEWYNNYIRKFKIQELTALRLVELHRLVACIGLQFGREITNETRAKLSALDTPLAQAARIDMELRMRGWQADIGVEILDQTAIGIVVISESGRVVEMNPVAQRIVNRRDGLEVRHGRIVPARAFEAARCDAFLAATLSMSPETRKVSRMLVRRSDAKRPYTLTFIASSAYPGAMRKNYAILLVSDPDQGVPTAADLTELYGLSPAESRLAAALAKGKKMSDICVAAGVKITTLRTQMRSILRKVGVQKYSDLLIALSGEFIGGAPYKDSPRYHLMGLTHRQVDDE